MVEINKTKVVLLIIIPLTLLSAFLYFYTESPSSPKDTGSRIGYDEKYEDYRCPDCNVILISIDTLRADHLGSHGYPKNTSPYIDRFASESILFENAIAQASWTAPSHMSIMTSLYPSVHKVKGFKGSSKVGRLDDSVVTLAQVLKANDYRTVSFNGGRYVNKEFGFDRGFDVYTSLAYDKIEITNNATFNWLSENRDQKFFLFFHTYAVHTPYLPPVLYGEKFFPDYNGSIDRKYTLSTQEIKADEIWKAIALYDGEINYMDHEVGRLLDTLDYLNLNNNTIVIFTSDHGHEFLEHGSTGHSLTSYQELIHVPLIIRFPGIKNSRIKNLVQSIDIMPTVLDSLNITGPSNLQGVSLLPLVREGKNVNSYAYSEGGVNGEIKAIIGEDLKWKYIYNVEDKNEELYDLENDPSEQNNLINERPEIAENLREELFRWMEENEELGESYSSSEAKLKNETKEALKALGYVV